MPDPVFVLVESRSLSARCWHTAGLIFLPEANRRTQRQAAVLIQLLSASPSHWISLSFDLNFRFQAQSLPFRSLRHRKLRLTHSCWQWISRIEAPAHIHCSVRVGDRHAEHARHAGNPVVHKSDDQSRITALFILPHPRGPHPVPNVPRQLINRIGKLPKLCGGTCASSGLAPSPVAGVSAPPAFGKDLLYMFLPFRIRLQKARFSSEKKSLAFILLRIKTITFVYSESQVKS